MPNSVIFTPYCENIAEVHSLLKLNIFTQQIIFLIILILFILIRFFLIAFIGCVNQPNDDEAETLHK